MTVISKGQVASSTPFDNSSNGFVADQVQAAIEELQVLTLQQSYPLLANYNGSANVGRYLEGFPGEASDTAPFAIPLTAKLLHVTVQATAATTGSIRIYNLTTAAAIYDAAFSGTSRQIYTNLNIGGISAGDELSVYVIGAAINKPKIRFWLQGTA